VVIGGRRSDREKKKESETQVTWVRPIVRLFPRGYGRLSSELGADKGKMTIE
jgi:hypothetical protein